MMIGTCDFCGHPRTPRIARLAADPDQRVCAECHEDPRLPTVADTPCGHAGGHEEVISALLAAHDIRFSEAELIARARIALDSL